MTVFEDQIYDIVLDEVKTIRNILQKKYDNDESMTTSEMHLLSLSELVIQIEKKLRELEK